MPLSPPKGSTPAVGAALEPVVRPLALDVDTVKLDRLLAAVSEIRAAIYAARKSAEILMDKTLEIDASLAKLTRISADIQRVAMSIRTIHLTQLFGRTARLARDFSQKTGKQVKFEMQAEGVQIDKSLAERLADCLFFLTAFLIEESLERPEVRIAAGKQSEGCIKLVAVQRSSEIIIEISGNGDSVQQFAAFYELERAQCPNHASQDGEAAHTRTFQLASPDASRGETPDGRPTDLTAVRAHIASLQGYLHAVCCAEKGTSFHLRIPLEPLLVEGLVAIVAGRQFLLPSAAVKELMVVTQDLAFTRIEGQELALIRQTLVPVVRLEKEFKLRPHLDLPANRFLVIADIGGKPLGMTVDQLVGNQQAPLQTSKGGLLEVEGISGYAVLDSGNVALILDLEAISRTVRRSDVQ